MPDICALERLDKTKHCLLIVRDTPYTRCRGPIWGTGRVVNFLAIRQPMQTGNKFGRSSICKRRAPSMHHGAGGGSRTHFSHPFHGCLLRVATRFVCSPSPEPIGLRWTSQPRPRCPRQFGPGLLEPYKLVENRERLSGLGEYLVPDFVCYLPCSVFCMDVPDQQSACLEDRHSVMLLRVYEDGLGACDD